MAKIEADHQGLHYDFENLFSLIVLSKFVSGVLTWLFKHSDNIFLSLKPIILSFGSLIKATTTTKEDRTSKNAICQTTSKTTALQVHYTSRYISLRSSHDYDI